MLCCYAHPGLLTKLYCYVHPACVYKILSLKCFAADQNFSGSCIVIILFFIDANLNICLVVRIYHVVLGHIIYIFLDFANLEVLCTSCA